MPSTPFHIRPAEEKDIDIILKLIKDLATYEKEPESAKATPELLRENLFERKYAHTLLAFTGSATSPGEPMGMALYFFNFSTWTGKPGIYLEDLFVKPEYRGSGVGKALFGELGLIAEEKQCGRIDWVVLTWNQPSIDFYERKLGAKAMKEWMGMRLEGDGIQNLKSLALKRE